MAALGAWLVFEDEAGVSMTPARARTWGRRGHTPVVRVRGRSRRRVSIAALTCYKPGMRSRLIYRPRLDDGQGRGRDRKSFAWSDYRDLIVAVHNQLGGPIVLIWDNLNTHLAAGMKKFIAVQDLLTVYQLPPYAPDLNRSKASGRCCDAATWRTSPSPTPTTSYERSDAAYGRSSTGPSSSTAVWPRPGWPPLCRDRV